MNKVTAFVGEIPIPSRHGGNPTGQVGTHTKSGAKNAASPRNAPADGEEAAFIGEDQHKAASERFDSYIHTYIHTYTSYIHTYTHTYTHPYIHTDEARVLFIHPSYPELLYICYLIHTFNLSKYSTLIEPVPYRTSTH